MTEPIDDPLKNQQHYKTITCDCKILLMIKNNYMRLLMIKIITCDCKILLMIKIITCTF